jgi:hypothetical protein
MKGDTMGTELLEHSPLGASGAYRWMICAGSVALSAGVDDPESEYATEGTMAHEAGSLCLTSHLDAWELITRPGETMTDWSPTAQEVFVDKDMADAVQVYLNTIRFNHPDRNQGNSFIERAFHCPDLHPLFYGRADYVYVDHEDKELHIYDYKHGAGVVVDVQDNPQLMYYAVGILEDLKLWTEVTKVTTHIIQPRGYHPDGPIRRWSISVLNLEKWLDKELLPAMERAMGSRDTKSGSHCRFCPARTRACPQLLKDFDELEKIMTIMDQKGGAKKMSNAQLARFKSVFDVAKIAAKAADKTMLDRLLSGKDVKDYKLVRSKTNRDWKDGAEEALVGKFGDEAMTDLTLKSPAQIEKLPEGKQYTEEWAEKPPGKITVAHVSDNRIAVDLDKSQLFTDQTNEDK